MRRERRGGHGEGQIRGTERECDWRKGDGLWRDEMDGTERKGRKMKGGGKERKGKENK